MKKITAVLLLVLVSFTSKTSEKITEFNTTHFSNGSSVTKMNIQFQLFDDKLVLNYLDNSLLKQLKKEGEDTFIVYPFSFSKVNNTGAEYYKYETDDIQIMVVDGAKPYVTIKIIDSFTKITQTTQTYLSF